MNIQQMHSAFRVIGQQMGLQLVRGILPESIDVYINAVISDITHNELVKGVHTAYQETTDTQPSTMGVSNLFRSLYRQIELKVGKDISSLENNNLSGVVLKDVEVLKDFDKNTGYYKIYMPTLNYEIVTDNGMPLLSKVIPYHINPMMYLGFSASYKSNNENDIKETAGKKYACRFIGADVLETTLRDFCNAATWDNPIVVLLSEYRDKQNDSTDGDSPQEYIELYTNSNIKTVENLYIKYIKQPNVVRFDINSDNCVNCDLPEYSHYNIVEQAVYKFYQSVGMTSGKDANQQRRQQ